MYDNSIVKYYASPDWLDKYFYSLHALKQYDKLREKIEEIIKEKYIDIENVKKDTDYSQDEKKDAISTYKKEIKEIEKVYKKITD